MVPRSERWRPGPPSHRTRSTVVEQRTVSLSDDTERTIDLIPRAGAIGVPSLRDTGVKLFTELPRIRTSHKAEKIGTHCDALQPT